MNTLAPLLDLCSHMDVKQERWTSLESSVDQWRSTLKNLTGPIIGHLDKLQPRPSQVARVKHHAALPFPDIGAFMDRTRDDTGVASRALELSSK